MLDVHMCMQSYACMQGRGWVCVCVCRAMLDMQVCMQDHAWYIGVYVCNRMHLIRLTWTPPGGVPGRGQRRQCRVVLPKFVCT